MGNLLFNPNGRIVRNRFWQGMVILTVASVLVAAGSVKLGFLFSLLTYVLIFPYICVYGKRLHDAGFTAWWVLVVWVGAFILNMILSLILTPFFTTEQQRKDQEEMSERLLQGDWAGFAEGAQIVAAEMLPFTLFLTVLVNLIVALVLGLLPTEPRENKHGPVPGMPSDDIFG